MKIKNKTQNAYPSRKKKSIGVYLKNNYQLYLMLLLPCLYLILFKYKPMLGIIVAFKDYNIFKGVMDSPWIGMTHFNEAFSSKEFWLALRNTLVLNFGDILIGFPIPIILAVFLNEISNQFIKKSTQIILYLPHFLSWVIIAGIIQQMFSETGLVNTILNKAGIESINFLSSNGWWRVVYWGSGVWAAAGYSLIIYMAALAASDPSLNEAAYIDGAGRMKRIWYVTIPQIRATITMMLIMSLGKVMSISFDRPYMMGNTLVKEASNVISTYVYKVGLQSGRYDFAAAVGVFQSVVGVILVLSVNKIAKKLGEEGII
jgi:putative aldouronate transport system permease protein